MPCHLMFHKSLTHSSLILVDLFILRLCRAAEFRFTQDPIKSCEGYDGRELPRSIAFEEESRICFPAGNPFFYFHPVEMEQQSPAKLKAKR